MAAIRRQRTFVSVADQSPLFRSRAHEATVCLQPKCSPEAVHELPSTFRKRQALAQRLFSLPPDIVSAGPGAIHTTKLHTSAERYSSTSAVQARSAWA